MLLNDNRHDENVKKERGQSKTTIHAYEIVPDFKPAQVQDEDEGHYMVAQAHEETNMSHESAEPYYSSDAQLLSGSMSCEKLHTTKSKEKFESVKPIEAKDEPNYKVMQTYEKIENNYERTETYERVHHNDAQLPKQLMSGLTLCGESSEMLPEEINDFKSAQIPVKGKANYKEGEKEPSYERAQTYEKIHHNDAQISKQLMSRPALCEELSESLSEEINDFKPTQVLFPNKGKANCTVDEGYERAQTYERIHQYDTQLPKQLISGLTLGEESSEIQPEDISDFKLAQVPTKNKANYKVGEKEQNYERAQTYERIYFDDAQLMKQLSLGSTCEKCGVENDEVL